MQAELLFGKPGHCRVKTVTVSLGEEKTMTDEKMRALNDDELQAISGGVDPTHNLSNFTERIVHDVVSYPGEPSSCLTFRREPSSSSSVIMQGYGFHNGDRLLVNMNFTENGYRLAYFNGAYGYVNANNV